AARKRIDAVRDSLVETHWHADQISLHYPIRYYNMLLSLADMVQSAPGAPTRQQGEVYRDLSANVDRVLAILRDVEATDRAAFHKLLKDLDVPAVGTPAKPTVVP